MRPWATVILSGWPSVPPWPGAREYLRLRLRCERLREAGRRSREYLRVRLRCERLRAAAAWPGTIHRPHWAWGLPEASPGPLQQSLAQLLHAAVHGRNRSRGIAEHQPMARLAVTVLHRKRRDMDAPLLRSRRNRMVIQPAAANRRRLNAGMAGRPLQPLRQLRLADREKSLAPHGIQPARAAQMLGHVPLVDEIEQGRLQQQWRHMAGNIDRLRNAGHQTRRKHHEANAQCRKQQL